MIIKNYWRKKSKIMKAEDLVKKDNIIESLYEESDDLKTNNSLFLKALGYISCGSLYSDYGSGGYWSSSRDNRAFAFYLGFYNSFIRMHRIIPSLKFTVRCITDIKQ